jgi:hypothetical protein
MQNPLVIVDTEPDYAENIAAVRHYFGAGIGENIPL